MIQCPVCSSQVESEAGLVRCEGCIWWDRAAASRARRRLDAFRKGAGDTAYEPDGCAVCAACRAYFQPRSVFCPLVLFYNAPHSSSPLASDGEPERFPVEAEEEWLTYLDEHGYPEQVEAYWRRLTQTLKEPTRPP